MSEFTKKTMEEIDALVLEWKSKKLDAIDALEQINAIVDHFILNADADSEVARRIACIGGIASVVTKNTDDAETLMGIVEHADNPAIKKLFELEL